ncbi:hypothetical protein [Brevundimonas sp.]|uniref:hypothetical protein n=1 Tax=Brevundimonas sp. TaxID=1871086 RepID=UPI003D1059E1
MAVQRASEAAGEKPSRATQQEAATEFPVREYISAMALELAQMARWDGDDVLQKLLESASALASKPLDRPATQIVDPGRRRPA